MADELRIQAIPLVLLILTLITFVVSYLWSVANGHVSAVFPSISDTGAFPPESCFFAEMANIGAVLMGLTVYFRYLILRDYAFVDNFPSFKALLLTNLVLGLMVALGVSLVANYQSVSLPSIHYTGAFILFGLGEVYMIIDVIICYHTAIFPNQSRKVYHVRAFISVLSVIFIVVMITAGVTSSELRQGGLEDPALRLVWRPQDGGWALHVASNVSEWIIGIAQLAYFATFMVEFKRFRMPISRLRPVDPNSTLRQGASPKSAYSGSSNGEDRETEPILKSKSKQFLYIGTGGSA